MTIVMPRNVVKIGKMCIGAVVLVGGVASSRQQHACWLGDCNEVQLQLQPRPAIIKQPAMEGPTNL